MMGIEFHKNKLGVIVGVILMGALILVACVASEQIQSPQVRALESPPPPTQAFDTSIPSSTGDFIPEKEDELSQGLGEGYPAPEYIENIPATPLGGNPSPEEGDPASPPVKTQLEATDPSTVNLSSGELQLVEFFAFW